MNLNTIEKFPNIRNLFFAFDIFEKTTPEFEEKKTAIQGKLMEKFTVFAEYDEIDCLMTENFVESQATGFQQGFAFAIKLLRECEEYET